MIMLLEKGKDKKFWKIVREDPAYRPLLDALLAQYEENVRRPIESLRYSDFRVYFENGNRSLYEAAYFTRRARLNACALLCLLYPEKEAYLTELQDAIWAICDEYNWALPAHLTDWERNNRSFIDLFAAETGFALSEIKYLLGDRLDTLIKSRISSELRQHIFEPFLRESYWWYTAESNWAAVCGGSVACAFLYEWPEKFYEVKPRIDEIIECFLSSYKEDGVCREGISYWEYGFGFFAFYADLLRQFSNGKYDYFKKEKVKTIACFLQKMFLTENVTVSFADGAMHSGYNLGLVHLLHSVYPECIAPPPFAYHTITDKCARWCWELRSFLYYDKNCPTGGEYRAEELYMQPSAWFVKKTKSYAFAAKGGDNGEPHNHNDVGTFLAAADGRQLLCDLGAGEYTQQYFDPKTRYQVFCNSSFSHCVPMINGKGQKAGKEYCGDMRLEDGRLVIDMTRAYGVPELSSLVREFIFEEDAVTLTDRFRLEGSFTERIVTLTQPEVTEQGVRIGGLRLEYDAENFRMEISKHAHHQHDGSCAVVYAVDFAPKSEEKYVFVLKMVFDM